MSVSAVGGDGSLNFTTNIETGNSDAQLDSFGKKLVDTFQSGADANKAFNDSVLNSLKTTGASFNPDAVNQWSDAVKKAASNMQEILSKASSGLDPTKLQAFDQQLSGTNTLFGQLGATIDFIKQNVGSLKLNDADSASLAESIKTIETSFDGFTEKTVKATTQIRALKNEMALMENKGSPEFLALATQAGALQKEVDESNKSVQLLASTTGGLQAGVGVLRGVVGGFEAVAGAVGLAGGKSEEMQGIISSIISAMGVLNGVSEFADQINKRSALNQFLLLQYRRLTATATAEDAVATTALAAAEGEQIVATEGATVATAELNAVMGLNPAFVLITAISALAAGIYFLTQKSNEADEASAKLNKTLLDQYTVANQIYELSKLANSGAEDRANAALSAAEAENKSQQEILAKQIELDKIKKISAESDLQRAKDALPETDKLKASIQGTFSQLRILHGLADEKLNLNFDTDDLNDLIGKLGALKNSIAVLKNSSKSDKDKTLIEKLESEASLLEPKIKNYIDSLKTFNSASLKLADDQTKKEVEDYKKSIESFTAAQDAKTLALAQSQQKQLDLTLDSIRAQAKAQLDPKLNPDLTAGDKEKIQAQSLKSQADAIFQFNQKQAADQVKLLQSQAQLQKEGSQERLNLDLQAIAVSTQAQLQQQILLNGQVVQYRKLSAEQIASITNESNKKIADLNKDYNKGVADDALETAIANDKARLASSTLSSIQELQLKKKLIDDQQALDITNAQFTINNQTLLAAKINEINSESAKAKQKLDDEQLQNTLDNNLKLIHNAAETAKALNNAILADPNSTSKAKTDATRGNLIIDAEAIKKQMDEITAEVAISLLQGNANVGKQVAQLQVFAKAYQAALSALAKPPKGDSGEAIRILNQTGSQISQLGSGLKQYNSSLGEVFVSLGGIAKNAATIVKLFSDINQKKNTTEEQIAAGLEATIQLISEVVAAGAARAQAESEFNNSLIAQQEQYNLTLNDSILLNSKLKDNVFVTNFQGEITDSIAALKDAQVKFQASLAALDQGAAKAGTRSVASGSAIISGLGSGALAGAEIGGFLGPEGAVIGGAIGAVVGGIVGFFGGKKPADKYVALLSAYPDLLQKGADGVTHINTALAQSLISNNQLSDSTKVLVQDTLDWQSAIDKANQQLKDVISTLAGSLGQDLSDSLTKAFQDGTDAGKAFADSVSKTLQQVVQQLLFNQVFGKAFDDLQAKLQASFQTGGTQDWQGALESFFNQYSGLTQEFDDALKTAQTEAQKAGLDIFKSTSAVNSANNNSLSGAIKGITETQADLLAGQFGGLRITAIDALKVSKDSLQVLNEIAFNTAANIDMKNILNYFKLNGIKVI